MDSIIKVKKPKHQCCFVADYPGAPMRCSCGKIRKKRDS